MRTVYALVALPFYAVAIGIEVCRVAYRMARLEAQLQREARDAVRLHRSDIEAEVAANHRRMAEERRWGSN